VRLELFKTQKSAVRASFWPLLLVHHPACEARLEFPAHGTFCLTCNYSPEMIHFAIWQNAWKIVKVGYTVGPGALQTLWMCNGINNPSIAMKGQFGKQRHIQTTDLSKRCQLPLYMQAK